MWSTTPLNSAIKHNHYDACVLLIEHGANINHMLSPLHEAVAYNRLEICKLLMDHGADIYAIEEYSTTYYRAAYYGHMDICELLLSGDLRDDVDYSYVLCYGVHWERHDLVKRLIRHGTDAFRCVGHADDGMRDYYEDFANNLIRAMAEVLDEYRTIAPGRHGDTLTHSS